MGGAASSENYVGCSSCHYGASVGGDLATSGVDANDTAHRAPIGHMANAEICGACHSRYSYTTQTFTVSPIPDGPRQTTLIQPQMALGGYPMLGEPAAAPATGWTPALRSPPYLNVQYPGWTPSPNPAATTAGFGRLQTYWQDSEGTDTLWQQTGHDGSAAQYPEWARSKGTRTRSPASPASRSGASCPRRPSRSASSATPPTSASSRRPARTRPALMPSTASPASAAIRRTSRHAGRRLGRGVRRSARSDRLGATAATSASSATTARSRRARPPRRAPRSIIR